MLPSRSLVSALLAAVLGALLVPVGPAHAADRTVHGGRLDWGIRSSFQSYVTGPVAHGSWRLLGGAATVGTGRFRFHSAAGSYDPGGGALEAAFSGGVRFTGHPGADGSYALDLTIARPAVRISGGRGTLYADMTSRAKGTGKVTTARQVPLAALSLGGIDMRGGGSPVALTDVPATLTSQGAAAFAGYYPAGTALDPVSLSVDTPTPSATSSPAPSRSASAGFVDAAVDWGVRRTFREYVTGPVARGGWTLSGGAQDGGALFRFPRGHGSYDDEKGTLDASFAGAVRFTGAHFALTLDRIAVEVADGRGTLSSAGRPLITFPAGRLAPRDGLVAVSEAPATLTAAGAKVFGGMYPAGTVMDPVSLAVAVEGAARLPALPDVGSGGSAAPSLSPSSPSPVARPEAAAASASSDHGPLYLGLVGAGLVAAAAIGFAVRRSSTAGRRGPVAQFPAPLKGSGDARGGPARPEGDGAREQGAAPATPTTTADPETASATPPAPPRTD
ncbi:HtaA domain-containing protein [Streptomyces sp. TLI_146]|uniref:HtaA domain-containing protein n=1 Tax=Streptomyces sp. TLI_146 TaxID=1938858 RepID=UPI000C6FCF8C|nr:HtaA domain-containing protein [Streptomyces sp. TLI_146]PKV85460.1 Htaa protein [Streptomyces sp. TLI_146]